MEPTELRDALTDASQAYSDRISARNRRDTVAEREADARLDAELNAALDLDPDMQSMLWNHHTGGVGGRGVELRNARIIAGSRHG